MILGRTPGGLIKTKSDGGLRAVNCACCEGECGCGIQIPQNLRTLVQGGNVTMYGVSPDYFQLNDDNWYAEFFPESGNFYCAGIRYFFETGCLGKLFLFIEFRNGEECMDGPCSGYGQFGTPAGCDEPAVGEGTFTINGQGEYPYYWWGDLEVPPPNLVFS